VAFALVASAALFACNKPSEPTQSQQPQQPAPPSPEPSAFVVTEELRAIWVAADTADGKEDHVVSKCITCKLGMNGNSSHAAKVGDYTAHLCSGGCKTAFEKNPAQAILAVKPK